MGEVVRVPPGLLAAGGYAALASGVLLHEGERHAGDDGEVLGRPGVAHGAVVVIEGDVQEPVQAVLDVPVGADGIPDLLGLGR